MDLKLARLIVFMALMESGEGIQAKSPAYVLETWDEIEHCEEAEALLEILDRWNQFTVENYMRTWKLGIYGEPPAEPGAPETEPREV